jgi:uroporphyrinogen-III synthase
MRLLVTRPQAEAERTAQALRRLGHEAVLAPVLHIEPVQASLGARRWSAIMMTSGNAARAIAQHSALSSLAGLPVFAVGRQTAAAAREAGFADVVSAEGNAGDLAQLVRARTSDKDGPLLYLAGNDISRDLAGELAKSGIAVETEVIYRAEAAGALPDDAREALASGALDGVLHYSRRSANIFLDCAAEPRLRDAARSLVHYCLSRRVAEPLAAQGFADIRVASGPQEAAMLDLVAKG